MFENYFANQNPIKNNEDLNNLIFKELIVESFLDNEIRFDAIIEKIKEKKISLFEKFTVHPEYVGTLENNNAVAIGRNDSDYSSFLVASTQFISNEKYILKLLNCLTKDEVQSNQLEVTIFILSLLDNNFKDSFNKFIENDFLSEKEIKLNLILPENPYYCIVRKKKFHELEIDFLSENIHELKVNNRNSLKIVEIYDYLLTNTNKEQYQKLTNTIRTKVDFSKMIDKREQLFKLLLDFGVIEPNEIIGDKFIESSESTIEIKSFLKLSENAIIKIKESQMINLEKRLSKKNTEFESIKKIKI